MRSCLIFDLDDTLFPEKQYVFSGFREIDRYLTGRHQLTGFFDMARELFNSGERGTIFNQYLDLKGIEYDKGFILKLVNIYRSHMPQITLFSDADWVLSHYSGTHKLGLITDGYYISQNNKIIITHRASLVSGIRIAPIY